MTLHVLIPCKRLTDGKSRLAPYIDAQTRRALCVALLQHTLLLASSVAGSRHVRLISSDEEACAMARRHQIATEMDDNTGLNNALDRGRTSIKDLADEVALLVLPIDLPWATQESLAAVIQRNEEVTVVPDREHTGTNVLLLRRRAVNTFRFAFGPDSLHQHRIQARQNGLSVATIESASLAFDIDSPTDFASWAGHFENLRLAAPHSTTGMACSLTPDPRSRRDERAAANAPESIPDCPMCALEVPAG